MTSVIPGGTPASNFQATASWINRGLELLWLLTVVLVPLAFLKIAVEPLPLPSPMEVAKIGVFRTLVGLMALLWLVEWGLRGRLPINVRTIRALFSKLQPREWLRRLRAWSSSNPFRWVALAAGFFLGAVIVSTLVSVSFQASLWGRNPGVDSYASYTVVCFFLLFGVIVTHLKTRSQLWRLLGAIIFVGVVVGSYSVLQFYNQDLLQLMAPGSTRMPSTLGNPIFASALLLMTIGASLTVATVTLVDPVKSRTFWRKTSWWTLVLAVQLAGSILSFSRGPWAGTLVALAGFLVLLAILVDWKTLGKASLLLGLAAMLAAVLAFLPTQRGWYERPVGAVSALEQVGERFTSLQLEATTSSLGQRLGIWQVSGLVIANRPWFEFEDFSFSGLRHVVGYGPDFFTPVFMLESFPVGPDMLPLETTHGHNYFIHQWVDLGLLGFVAVVGIFLAVFLVGGHQVLWRKSGLAPFHRIVLAGLLAVLAGRWVEQMVGVAKVSDLVLFWVLLAVLVSLPAVLGSRASQVSSQQPPPTLRGERRTRVPVITAGRGLAVDSGLLWRSAVVVLLAVGIVFLTWNRTFNNVRALIQASGLNESFNKGDLPSSSSILHQAIRLAPDADVYRGNLGQVYQAYLSRDQGSPERDCGDGATVDLQYQSCLAEKIYRSRLNRLEQGPWRWRSRLELANAAAHLASLQQDPGRAEEAIQLYAETAAMAPHSWKLRNHLANMQVELGDPQAGLSTVEESLAITGDSANSAEALLLGGLAYVDLGQPTRAIENYGRAIQLDPQYVSAHNNLGNVYARQGQFELAIREYSNALQLDPQYFNAYRNRALAYAALGMDSEARQDAERAVEWGADPGNLEKALDAIGQQR